MEENKKSNKGLIVLVVLLIACIFGLVGYIVYDKFILTEEKNTDTSKNTNNSQLYDENTELVYVCEKVIDESGNEFNVPCINSDKKNASEINRNIYNIINENKEIFDDVKYEYFTNDNIISLLINMNGFIGDGSGEKNVVYNFDKNTFELISNSDILNSLNISMIDFINNYNKILKESFDSELDEFEKNAGFSNIKDMVYYHELNNIDDFKIYINNKRVYAQAYVAIGNTMGIEKFIVIN